MRIWKPVLCLAIAALPAGVGAQVIGHMTPAEPITLARIATLPKVQQAAWRAYLDRSVRLMAADKAALSAERGDGPVPAPPSPGPSGGSGMPLDRPADWYASPEARHVADNIVSFQTPAGGWGKNVDRTGPLRQRGQDYIAVEHLPTNARTPNVDENWSFVGTIDNNATTTELRFLARVQAALPGADGAAYRASLLKGLRYLLDAQFPNGGWPQVYPLEGGYHDALTYNDDAMSDVVMLLSDVGARHGDYAAVPASLAAAARTAVAKAVRVILVTQVRVNGKRTVWGQQHDALTLAPAGARNFEPASLSSFESADLLMLLMRLPDPTPEVRGAVADGVAWLSTHAIRGVEWARGPEGRMLSPKPGAGPLWARYYDITTGKPIFGDRDKSIHDDVNELSRERRDGYSWYSPAPRKAIERYAAWSAAQSSKAR